MLGKTFSREALAALAGIPEPELEPLLSALVRKEVLGVQADPRSPERGQYGFLQDLVRRVAYETLARRERKSRHLAAAALLESSFGEAEQEIVEVVASHYLAAYEAQPDAEDAAEIRSSARELLARAGERAGSLAAVAEARRYFEQAAGLAEDPLERARLLDRAGWMAYQNAELEAAEGLFAAAHELLAPLDTHAAAAVSARLAADGGGDRTRRTGTLAPGSCVRRCCRRRTGRGRRRGRSPGSDRHSLLAATTNRLASRRSSPCDSRKRCGFRRRSSEDCRRRQ